MNLTLERFLNSWSLDPWVYAPLALTAWVYVRGWRLLRQRGASRFGPAQLAAFLGGVAVLFVALCSPVDTFAALLLQVHMAQHMLLLMLAPPLLLLAAPVLPLLRGLPEGVRRYWIAPLFRWDFVRFCFRKLTSLPIALALFVGSTWLWHAPQFYEVTLGSDGWHYLEHSCFLATAMLFWWPIILPYPSRPRWSRWALLPYLFLADVQNTALSAALTFSNRVLYPHYAHMPRLWGISALDDQAAAGVIMWVPGSIAFLLPLMWIGAHLLYGREEPRAIRGVRSISPTDQVGREPLPSPSRRIALPLVLSRAPEPRRGKKKGPVRWDILLVPLVGPFLKWRHVRLTLQVPMFLLSAAVILDGLFGPQIAPMNLAGVLPWIHWRGLVVLGLLIGGNVFCMACPFMLPRTLARKWLPGQRHWPRWLRAKWLAAGMLVFYFWAYESFSLWDSPWWTAWIAVGYFLAAFVIDGCFRGAAFCKYVCPIGQFNFVQSLISPLEVAVRDPEACLHCTTKDCIRGGNDVPGCELHLFLPRKSGNMDCTFCLDCVHACPHDNIGILAVTPASGLLHDAHRSGIGRLSRRPDLAALVLVLVFAAFANAAGMVAPVVEGERQLAASLGLADVTSVATVVLLGSLVVLPLLLVAAATGVSRRWSGDTGRFLQVAARYSYALVPLGFGMWLAHYSFHFGTGAGTVIPVVRRLAVDVGLSLFVTDPQWACTCGMTSPSWLLGLEIVFVELGFLTSLYIAYRIAQERCPPLPRALKAFAPWAVLILLLFVTALWILFQPMQMRGMMPM